MNWKKVIQKGGLGILTFVVAYLASHPQLVVSMIPEDIRNMTVGSFVAMILVAASNWWKHRKD